jgi:hypothetical protein
MSGIPVAPIPNIMLGASPIATPSMWAKQRSYGPCEMKTMYWLLLLLVVVGVVVVYYKYMMAAAVTSTPAGGYSSYGGYDY